MLSKLASIPRSSTFGVQTVVRRMKSNQWGSYGYSNFGHDKPDHFPLITKVFHAVVGVGFLMGVLNWSLFWPMITKSYYSVQKTVGVDVPEEKINPPEKKLKFIEHRRKHRDRTYQVNDPKDLP
ncbi:unnamed protein product [Allacma fusca]|uniref:Uncharacterized protein n=1 Tax=Allacma fusca TaxID=39272 RepID=A0A8J2JNV9_9HEXA|nr:unnamed protein product [Allacma fusca]